jgi:hypothetical protein
MSKDLKRLIVNQADEKQELIQQLLEDGVLQKRPRASKTETSQAYTRVLDTGENASDALKWLSTARDKPEDWVEAIKHSPLYKSVIDYSIKNNLSHPTSTLMKDKGVWTTGSKRSLQSASTLSSFLNTLSKQVDLTVRVSDLENLTQLLVDHAITTEGRLDKLEEKNVIKEKALLLLEEGYTVSEVAEKLDKHRNTIRTWSQDV